MPSSTIDNIFSARMHPRLNTWLKNDQPYISMTRFPAFSHMKKSFIIKFSRADFAHAAVRRCSGPEEIRSIAAGRTASIGNPSGRGARG